MASFVCFPFRAASALTLRKGKGASSPKMTRESAMTLFFKIRITATLTTAKSTETIVEKTAAEVLSARSLTEIPRQRPHVPDLGAPHLRSGLNKKGIFSADEIGRDDLA